MLPRTGECGTREVTVRVWTWQEFMAVGPAREGTMAARWLRGNLHSHTTNSDGDSSPADVVAWYRDAGFHFLALTDHDVLTDPKGLLDVAGPMRLIRGEEVTSGNVHVNGLGIGRQLPHAIGSDVRETLQLDIDAIREAGGVPSVNHPNFRWQVRPEDLARLTDVRLSSSTTPAPRRATLAAGPGSHPPRPPGTFCSPRASGCAASRWTTRTTSRSGARSSATPAWRG